jgi:hypothetical protein
MVDSDESSAYTFLSWATNSREDLMLLLVIIGGRDR